SLAADGHRFRSETDTEVIAHLIEQYYADGLETAVRRAARELRGSYAVACIAVDAPETLVAVRSGSSPLVIGIGDGEMFLASDIPALLGETREIVPLAEGDVAVLTPGGLAVTTLDGAAVRREPTTVSWDAEAAEKSGYPHFMLKEIFEQPDVIRDTLRERVDLGEDSIRLPELGLKARDLAGLYPRAGIEIGVASTKAFTAQLTAITLLALKLGRARGFADDVLVRQVLKSLSEIPDLMPLVLEQSDAIRKIATRFAASKGFLYLGRGMNHPLALE